MHWQWVFTVLVLLNIWIHRLHSSSFPPLQTLFPSSGYLRCSSGLSALMWLWWASPSPRRFCLWQTAAPEALLSWSTCPLTAAQRSLRLTCPSRTKSYYKWWALLNLGNVKKILFSLLWLLISLFFLPTERKWDYSLLSSSDLWPAGPARVCSIFSLCLSGS